MDEGVLEALEDVLFFGADFGDVVFCEEGF